MDPHAVSSSDASRQVSKALAVGATMKTTSSTFALQGYTVGVDPSQKTSESSGAVKEWLDGLALVAGVAAFGLYIILFDILAFFPAARFLSSLLRQHGVQLADRYWLVFRHLLEAIFVTAAGVVVGRIAWRHWRHFALIFAVGFLMLPIMILAPRCTDRTRPREWVQWSLMVAVPTPFILLGAWSSSRPRRRRALEWEQRGLCMRCSYDLTGNVSGVCPECGTKCENAEPQKHINAEME